MSLITKTKNFIIKGISPLTINDDFQKGKFKHIDLDYIKKIRIDFNNKLTDINNIGKTPESDIFIKNSYGNASQIFCTDNCNVYNSIFTTHTSTNHECHWCRCPFSGPPIGIPVEMERTQINERVVWIFHSHGYHCSFECTLANTLQEIQLKNIPLETKTYLLMEFGMIYPDKKLIKSPHWTLHVKNGGPLEDKEFHSNTHHFVKTSNVVHVPVKNIYEKIKND